MVAPLWAIIAHCDIVEGACFGTLTTTDAFVGGVKWPGRHAISFEVGVDDSSFYPCPAATYHIVAIIT